MSELRVGLAGYGTAGAFFHAPLIAATPGLRLAAVSTRSPERAAEIGARYGAEVVPEAEALLGRCDLVVVATPNDSHVPLAAAALAAGTPVVVDKPLAMTAADAEGLVQLADDSGVMLTVFQNRRWDGDFRTVRRLLPSLGTVTRFESRFERWRPAPKGGWRESSPTGGLLFDLGPHLADQAIQLLGPVREVYAESDVRRAGVASDDDTFIALTHAGGARSHLWASAVAASFGPRFRVLGSVGAYVKEGLDVQEERLRGGLSPAAPGFGDEPRERWGTLTAADGTTSPAPTEPGDYLAFYRAVARGERPVDPREAVETLRVLEAAKRSAAERAVVRLPA